MTKILVLALCASGLALAACGHDKTYVVESEPDTAVVERQTTVVEPAPTATATTTTTTTAMPTTAAVSLAPEQTQIVREYYIEQGCPSGLVQQGTACVAPGVVTQRYVVGEPLPQDIVVVDLPSDLVTRLPALPDDYEYRIVDGDLAIVRQSTHVVIDVDELD